MSGTPYLAVIGTAGRRDDAARMSRGMYDAMYDQTCSAMRDWGITHLVSGGAAWADHLAVRAYLDGTADHLMLALPARWNGRGFDPNPRVQFNPGQTLARYHAAFSREADLDSMGELRQAIDKGAHVEVHEGFHRRNMVVAQKASHILAFTFGRGSLTADFLPDSEGFSRAAEGGLKDGGTAHTWEQSWRARQKRHVNLFHIAPSPGPAAGCR